MSMNHSRLRSRALAAAAALALGIAGALGAATTANAVVDSFEVTVATGSGAGTLADAITKANADPDASTITFSPTVVAGGTITVDNGGLPEIYAGSVAIQGPTTGTLVIAANDDDDQGFRAWGYGGIAPEYSVSISDLTISGFFMDIELGYVESTLDRLVLIGGTSRALSATNVALTATDITVEGAGDYGIFISDNEGDPTPVSLENVTVSGHDAGVGYSGQSGATATFRNVTSAATVSYGFWVDLNSGAHVDLVSSDGAGPWHGLDAFLDDASLTVTGSDFHDAGFGGVLVDAEAGSEVEIADSQVFDNIGGNGGGIEAYVYNSTLEIGGTVVHDNVAGGDGGGIAVSDLQGGDAWVRIVRSTITGNEAGETGGGIQLNNIGMGGPGSAGVSIEDTEITENEARDGAGVAVAYPGLYSDDSGWPSVIFERTTIAANEAEDNGGGVYLAPFGYDAYGPVAFANSTIAGNTAGVNGGAAYVVADQNFRAYFDLTTIADNSSGIFLASSPATVGILYSILANNGGNDLERDDATIEVNWSLIEAPEGVDATADVAAGMNNIVGVDPQLGTLADNGGATRTMRPAITSPAVNAGDPALLSGDLPDGGDQRGGGRLVNRLDLGAVELTTLELSPAALAATGPSPVGPATAVLLLLLGGIALLGVRKRANA